MYIRTPVSFDTRIGASVSQANSRLINMYQDEGALVVTGGVEKVWDLDSEPFRIISYKDNVYVVCRRKILLPAINITIPVLKSVSNACPFAASGRSILFGDMQLLDLKTYKPSLILSDVGNVVSMAFLDNRYYVADSEKNRIWCSSIEKESEFPSLNYATMDDFNTDLTAIVAHNGLLYVFSRNAMEVWRNVGTKGFPLVRVNSSQRTVGLKSDNGYCVTDRLWFTDGRCLYVIDGYSQVKVSKPDVENEIAKIISPITLYSYTQFGHEFVVLANRDAETSFAYDTHTQLWHELGQWGRDGAYNGHDVISASSDGKYTYVLKRDVNAVYRHS